MYYFRLKCEIHRVVAFFAGESYMHQVNVNSLAGIMNTILIIASSVARINYTWYNSTSFARK